MTSITVMRQSTVESDFHPVIREIPRPGITETNTEAIVYLCREQGQKLRLLRMRMTVEQRPSMSLALRQMETKWRQSSHCNEVDEPYQVLVSHEFSISLAHPNSGAVVAAEDEAGAPNRPP